jgi:hypothetical protein
MRPATTAISGWKNHMVLLTTWENRTMDEEEKGHSLLLLIQPRTVLSASLLSKPTWSQR